MTDKNNLEVIDTANKITVEEIQELKKLLAYSKAGRIFLIVLLGGGAVVASISSMVTSLGNIFHR